MLKQPIQRNPDDGARLITGEELYAMGDLGRTELIDGQLVSLMPTGKEHGRIEALIAILLGMFVLKTRSGNVLSGETGVYIRRNPDSIRAFDVGYISAERWERSQSTSYLDVAPELVVEVLSPNDSWQDVQAKLADYFAIDVVEVWIVAPQQSAVYVYYSLTDVTLYQLGDTLRPEAILPGFELAVADIFAV